MEMESLGYLFDPTLSGHWIVVIYYGLLIFAPVQTFEWNEHMTLSKNATTHGKENKETGNEYELPDSRLFSNCLEDSSEF